MKRSALKNLRLYPHFKLTNEKFPRLLVTRKIENDDAEYFGAFLPKSGARVLLGFVNKMFRLRSCEIDIEKGLPFPCPMFYRKRCLAPCVKNICDEEEYREMAGLLRLFLANERAELKRILSEKILECSTAIDFENAAKWRDLLFEIETLWNDKRAKFWLDSAIDTWEIIIEDPNIIFNLVTQRGRKILGSRSFHFEKSKSESIGKSVEKVFLNFYKIYVPKEIRVLKDFESRKTIAGKLRRRFGKNVQLFVQYDLTPTTKKGLRRNKFDSNLEKISNKQNFRDIQKHIKKTIKLKRIPKRIEAFDVGHILGQNVVAAKVVWEDGKFLRSENEVWSFGEMSERQAITEAVRARFHDGKDLPQLILIDGGKTQMKAALQGVSEFKTRESKMISAVKPKGKHDKISHFLDEELQRIEFVNEDTFFFLTNLRDKSHDLANQNHADTRDTNHFYELAMLLPDFSEEERRSFIQKLGSIKRLKEARLKELETAFDSKVAKRIYREIRKEKDPRLGDSRRIIPIRFDAIEGNAEDLQPIGSVGAQWTRQRLREQI